MKRTLLAIAAAMMITVSTSAQNNSQKIGVAALR